MEQYKKAKPTLMQAIEPYMVTLSQDDAGITHQAQDQVHVVPLNPTTKQMLTDLEGVGVSGRFVFDSDMGVRAAIHQVESGALLYEDALVMLPNTEVVDYLKQTFGDTDEVAYFTHYRSTRMKLAEHFKQAKLFSSIAHAEGVDLSHMKHMVLVNTAFSGAKFAQVRERGVNLNRTTPVIVHHIVTDAGISRDVYDAVSAKKNWNLQAFRAKRRRAA